MRPGPRHFDGQIPLIYLRGLIARGYGLFCW